MASQIQQVGQMLAADVLAWGAAAIGIALAASAVVWIARILRAS